MDLSGKHTHRRYICGMCSQPAFSKLSGIAPIAVLSFNRPLFLRPVRESLVGQILPIDGSRIHLFQDGARSVGEGGSSHEQGLVDECVQIFRRAVPKDTEHRASRNFRDRFQL